MVDILRPEMRAWFLGLLLAVMSIQFGWASVAVYCEHEADVVTDHIGHHEHQHEAGSAASNTADVTPDRELTPLDKTLGGVDNDCSYCHLGCAQPLAFAAEAWLGNAAHKPVVRAAPTLYASREPEGLERPNWHGLARSASLEERRTV